MTDGDTTTADEGRALNWVRLGVGLLGFLVLAAGFTTADALLADPLSTLSEAVDDQYLLLMAVGGVALGLAALAFLSGRDSVETTDPPEVERPTPAPTPGDPFEDNLDSWRHWVPLVARRPREAVRTRLREAAVAGVKHDRDVSDREAAQRVDDGSWTRDSVAAAFLSAGGPGFRPSVWFAALLRRETPVGYQARRAMNAIETLHGHAGDA